MEVSTAFDILLTASIAVIIATTIGEILKRCRHLMRGAQTGQGLQ